jgi:hypothetical protein
VWPLTPEVALNKVFEGRYRMSSQWACVPRITSSSCASTCPWTHRSIPMESADLLSGVDNTWVQLGMRHQDATSAAVIWCTTDIRNNSTAHGCVACSEAIPHLPNSATWILYDHTTARRVRKGIWTTYTLLCYQVVSLLSRDQVTKE